MGKQLSEADRQYGWGQIAFNAARKHHPAGTGNWYREAGNGKLDQEELDWKVRAALRQQDWATVLGAIDAMSSKGQNDPAWRYWKARALKAQGRSGEANELWAPLSRDHHFYALLAREELGSFIDSANGRFKPERQRYPQCAAIAQRATRPRR
jgi:soluble lytic murein transglycosylase